MALEDKSSAQADGLRSGFTPSDMGCADSGTSFYREILPPGTLHLGFSATAIIGSAQNPATFPTTSTWSGQPGGNWSHFETRVVPCPFAAEFRQHGDAEKFTKAYAPTIRSWNESIFYNALSPQRDVEERRELIEEIYSTYQQRVRKAPKGHGMDYVLA